MPGIRWSDGFGGGNAVRFVWVDRDEFDRRFVGPLLPAAIDSRSRIGSGSS